VRNTTVSRLPFHQSGLINLTVEAAPGEEMAHAPERGLLFEVAREACSTQHSTDPASPTRFASSAGCAGTSIRAMPTASRR
jgi:hypothetical protein